MSSSGSQPATIDLKSTYFRKLKLLFITFLSAVIDQSYDFYMISYFITKEEYFISFLFWTIDFLPGTKNKFRLMKRYPGVHFKIWVRISIGKSQIYWAQQED